MGKRVYICEDHPLFMQSLEQMVDQAKDLEFVGSATNGNAAIRQLAVSQADVVILDLNLPQKNGFEVLKFLQTSQPNALVIILTSYNDQILADKARRMGAAAYLLKDTDSEELLEVVLSAAKEKFQSNASGSTRNGFTQDQEFTSILKLTRTERKLVNGLIKGDSVSGLSEKFKISENTVKNHKKNIYRKLEVKTQAELILLCQKHGLID